MGGHLSTWQLSSTDVSYRIPKTSQPPLEHCRVHDRGRDFVIVSDVLDRLVFGQPGLEKEMAMTPFDSKGQADLLAVPEPKPSLVLILLEIESTWPLDVRVEPSAARMRWMACVRLSQYPSIRHIRNMRGPCWARPRGKPKPE